MKKAILIVCVLLFAHNLSAETFEEYASRVTPEVLQKDLSEWNIDIFKEGYNGPLYSYIVMYTEYEENIPIIMQRVKTKVDTQQDGQRNLLMRAAETNWFPEVIIALLEYFPINDRDWNGYSALLYAGLNPNPEILKVLIDNGAKVHSRAKGGQTLLHIAAEEGWPSTVEYILTTINIDVNAKNDGEETPLMLACTGNSEEIVRLLLDNGADATLENNLGHTAFNIAKSYNRLNNTVQWELYDLLYE